MSARVTTAKTAKTPSSTQTISDWIFATEPAPSWLTTAMPTTASEARMLSQ